MNKRAKQKAKDPFEHIRKFAKDFKIKEADIKKLVSDLNKKIKLFDKVTVKCGITGVSGSGKSSLINSIIGKKIVEVNIVEQTFEPIEVKHNGLILVDLPGIGTKKWPKASYVKKLKLDDYDYFILVTANRFYENDVYLYNELTKKLGKPCFVVRNKFDIAIQDGKYDHGHSEIKVRKIIEENIRGDLKGHSPEQIYLTSARQPQRFDISLLLENVSNALTGMKRKRFIADMGAWNEKAFKAKKEVADEIVGNYAGLAAINGLNPVPGLDISVDLGLLLKLSKRIAKIYGLTEENSEYYQQLLKKSKFQAIKQRIVQITAKYLTKKGILLLLTKLGTRVALKSVAKYIPFVGQIVAAVLGFKITSSYGEALTNECETVGKEIFNEIIESVDEDNFSQ